MNINDQEKVGRPKIMNSNAFFLVRGKSGDDRASSVSYIPVWFATVTTSVKVSETVEFPYTTKIYMTLTHHNI